jgi:hypothetical protein
MRYDYLVQLYNKIAEISRNEIPEFWGRYHDSDGCNGANFWAIRDDYSVFGTLYANPHWELYASGEEDSPQNLSFRFENEYGHPVVEVVVDFPLSFDLDKDAARYFELCREYIPQVEGTYEANSDEV